MSLPTVTVLTPDCPSTDARELWERDMRWVFRKPHLVAQGRAPRTVSGPDVPTKAVIIENGVRRETTFMAPAWTKVGPDDQGDVCPVWGDIVPWKSATVVVPPELEDAAAYCLACAHGGGWSRRKVLEDGRIALRSDYQAW